MSPKLQIRIQYLINFFMLRSLKTRNVWEKSFGLHFAQDFSQVSVLDDSTAAVSWRPLILWSALQFVVHTVVLTFEGKSDDGTRRSEIGTLKFRREKSRIRIPERNLGGNSGAWFLGLFSISEKNEEMRFRAVMIVCVALWSHACPPESESSRQGLCVAPSPSELVSILSDIYSASEGTHPPFFRVPPNRDTVD